MEGFKVNVVEQKNRIANYVRSNGPLVAHNIAKTLNINGFLASALLSELLKDKIIFSTSIRVGSGPLYYVPGQEAKFEDFTSFLKGKEREAHFILKGKGVVEDKKCEPSIRVAFRNMKDFAYPLVISKDGQEGLFWKFYLLSQEEASVKIGKLLDEGSQSLPQGTPLEVTPPEVAEVKTARTEEEVLLPKQDVLGKKEDVKEEEIKQEVKKPRAAKKKTTSSAAFYGEVRVWMDKNGVTLKREISNEGKMNKAVVEVDSGIGKLEFLLLAKDKKSFNEGDVALSYQDGSNEGLPVILLLKGKLTKKAEEVAEGFKGRLTIRKL